MPGEGIYLVTGAASGIGRASAGALAARGCNLLLCDVQQGGLDEVATALRGGGKVETQVADITSADDLATLQASIRQHGGLDGCIHAAGLGGTQGSAERVLAVNLAGTDALLDALLPVANRGSAVVCIASQAGHFFGSGASDEVRAILAEPGAADIAPRLGAALGVATLDGGTAYGLSKFGVLRLVVNRAGEFGRLGVRLLSLSPGIIDTPMASAEMQAHTDSMQAIIDMTPVDGRKGRPEELAAVAAFLCSPEASFVCGVDILVDGGSTGQVLNNPG